MTKQELSKVNSQRCHEINERKKKKTYSTIFNTVREMIKDGEEITVFRVSKLSGLSFNTVKKYRDWIEAWA